MSEGATTADATAAAAATVVGSDEPVLAIVGPTASGKSGAALQVAAARGDVELVAVDAFTIYRGMDIGTAKPSAADRAAVPHHCVDLLEPDADVAVSWFQEVARAAIADVRSRGRVPLLVGGSGLYFRAVVDDMRFPPTDDEVRARLERDWAGRPEEAHAAVAARDPDAAARIEPNNLRRSVRALEVMELTGRPFSEFAGAAHRSVVGDLTVAYLEPPGELLRARIDARAVAMVEAGLVEEMAALRERVGTLSTTAAQGIGYAEAAAVLDGELARDELAATIATRTRQYARRQRQWFRRDPRCAAPCATPEEVVARLAGDEGVGG